MLVSLGTVYQHQTTFKLPISDDNMNFLAHLLVSKNDEQVMVGNFIGDFVKGSQIHEFGEQIQKGIRLHRAIDSYTDSHPVVMESKKRLRGQYRHYSPVIVDVFYDHFIARDWQKFSSEPLLDFTQRFYKLMEKYATEIPKSVNQMLVYMRSGNWLYNYQFVEGINQALTGMSKRTKFQSKMEYATSSLEENYEDFEREFHQFFPQLLHYTENFEK